MARSCACVQSLWCRRAPRRRRRTPASFAMSRACCAGSPPSILCGRCRGCRTSRNTGSRGARRALASLKAYSMLTPSSGACCDAVHDRGSAVRPLRGWSARYRSCGETGCGSRPWPECRSASARWCRCGCRPSARRPAWSTDRRVHRVRPADRVMVVGLRPAELVDLAREELGVSIAGHAVQHGHLVEGAVQGAFGARRRCRR